LIWRFSFRSSTVIPEKFSKNSSLVITVSASRSWIQLYWMSPDSVSILSAMYTGMPRGLW